MPMQTEILTENNIFSGQLPLEKTINRLVKRMLDVLFSLFIFMVLFSWLWPIVSFLIRLSGSGHLFFKQEREGKNSTRFYLYKFRSLHDDCKEFSKNGKFLQVSRNDTRLTTVGRFLRKNNLDELPQFLNVLKGEMSIVGPRPHPVPLNMEYENIVNGYRLRHLVKPGITGLAQVNGFRGETNSLLLMQQRIDNDIWYIENWSLKLDIKLILLTMFNMIKGDKTAY